MAFCFITGIWWSVGAGICFAAQGSSDSDNIRYH